MYAKSVRQLSSEKKGESGKSVSRELLIVHRSQNAELQGALASPSAQASKEV